MMRDDPVHESSEEAVLQALRRLIAARALTPGQQIRQQDLAEEAGVSRVPVRQALARLGAEGSVRIVPNKGAYLVDFSVRELQDLHATRELLEDEALRLACKRATDADVDRVEARLEQLEAKMATDAPGDISESNCDFHFELLSLCDNTFMVEMIRRCWQMTMPYRVTYLGLRDRWPRLIDEHRVIFTAFKERDIQPLLEANRTHRGQFVTELIPWLKLDLP